MSGMGPEDSGAGDLRKARLVDRLCVDTPIQSPFSGGAGVIFSDYTGRGSSTTSAQPSPRGRVRPALDGEARSPRERLCSSPQRPAAQTAAQYQIIPWR